ncbi:MAG TPA: oligosaccharide flippase family protein, partial [Rubricoccaceae bacterium]
LYTPEAFGVLTLVTTAVSLLSAVAHGGYRYAVLLPERDDDAGGLVGLALGGAVLTTALVLAGVGVALAAGWTDDGAAWALLPLALLALDASQTAETWLTRRDRFRSVSASRVAQSAVVVAVQVGGGLAAAGAVGLVGGAAAGFVASLVVAGTAVWRADGPALARAFRPGPMRALARRYVRFPAFSAPAALLNLTATRLPVLLLAAFAGEAVVGQFGVAYGTLALPLGLVTGAAGQVFFARAATAVRDGTLPGLTRDTLRGLLTVTVFPSLAVVAAGPALFAFVFGPAWEPAGVFARLIAPWVLAASVAAPLTALFDVLERQRADLGFSVFMAAVQTAVLVAAGLAGTPAEMVLAASIAGAALRVAHVAWMLRLAGVPAAPVLRDVAAAFGSAAPLAALVWAVDASGAGGVWTAAATAAGGALTLVLAARRSRPPRRDSTP